ncbi:MAG: hypothetical protein CM1200mP5_1570 [Candidatus Pelagibacterales bacterium]|nr:MAG: hypothetical protein CM1200mP5_1570 [Pelagibacterales bacterium]
MRPKYRTSGMGITWQFPAIFLKFGWLEHNNYEYDIITDEDLHKEGLNSFKTLL